MYSVKISNGHRLLSLKGFLVIFSFLYLSFTASIGAANYLGCYVDKSDRDIKGYSFNGPQMTNQMCLNVCKNKGFRIAATQFSTHCFCGNSYGKYGRAPKQADCNYPCKGNTRANCGGYWRNSVYRVGAGAVPPSGNQTKACRGYANHAIKQQNMNVSHRCGFTGGGWHTNYNNHNRWCLNNYGTGVPANAQRARSDALVKCNSASAPFNLGHIWIVNEYAGNIVWKGVWTRRGSTNIFDAKWKNSRTGQTIRDVIEYKNVKGSKITLYRRGTRGTYTGRLSNSKRGIVNGTASWYSPGTYWEAQIK